MPATYEPIATTTLTSAQSSVTFSAISGSYTDLILIVSGRLTGGGGASAVRLQFNSDTGSNYSNTIIGGDGTSATSQRNTNATSMNMGLATDAAGQISTNIMQVMNYSNSTTNKTVISRSGIAGDRVRSAVGLWRNTNAITTIDVINDGGTTFVADSTFTLYGIKAA